MNKKIIFISIGIVMFGIGAFFVKPDKEKPPQNQPQPQNQNLNSPNENMGISSIQEHKIFPAGTEVIDPDKSVLGYLTKTGNHKSLVLYIESAGLTDTLNGMGPFTIFAPTDLAFNKLPDETTSNLLLPENKNQLTNFITYHLVSGTYKSSDFKNGMTLKTISGKNLTVSQRGEKWYVDNILIETSEINSENGIIYITNTVLQSE